MHFKILSLRITVNTLVLISPTLSRRLTMHLSDTSSIAEHLKISWTKTDFRKILTENTTLRTIK